MNIEVLDYSDFGKFYVKEDCLQRVPYKYPYETWERIRLCLIKQLSKHGVPDKTGHGTKKLFKDGSVEYKGGDFFIGEDWFESGLLSLIILKWTFLTKEVLQDCQKFLCEGRQEYLIEVVKATPKPEDMFDMIVKASRSYLCFYKTSATGAHNIIQRDDKYKAIRLLNSASS